MLGLGTGAGCWVLEQRKPVLASAARPTVSILTMLTWEPSLPQISCAALPWEVRVPAFGGRKWRQMEDTSPAWP